MNILVFFSPIENFDIINFIFFKFSNFLDFSITNISIYIIFNVITLLTLSYISLINWYLLPSFIKIFENKIFIFIFDIINKQIGLKGIFFFPFLLILFYFILFLNLYGLIPLNFSPTSHLIITFFFSIVVWIISIIVGFYENSFNFFKLFVPNVPIYLLPFLIIIEILSYIIRVFSLAIRLAANITSGHVLLFTISGFSIKLFKLNWFMAFFSSFLLLFVFFLEIGVSFLQAYVFITLACIYLNDSLNLSH